MEKYRTMLLKSKLEIEARIASAHYEQTNSVDSIEEIEQVQERNSKEVLAKILEKDSLKLRLIKEAILNIEKGDYGECTSCGNDIGEKRLTALPLAKNCVECQEEKDYKSAPFTTKG